MFERVDDFRAAGGISLISATSLKKKQEKG
jgi:hypothetical protein